MVWDIFKKKPKKLDPKSFNGKDNIDKRLQIILLLQECSTNLESDVMLYGKKCEEMSACLIRMANNINRFYDTKCVYRDHAEAIATCYMNAGEN